MMIVLHQQTLFQPVCILIAILIKTIKSEDGTDNFQDFLNEYNISDNFTINNNNETLEELLDVSWYTTAIFTLLFVSLSAIAVLGNSLIIWIVIKNPKMHNVTNYFICNLAMADIVIGLFAIPFQFQAALLQYWALPKILCKVAPFAAEISVNVSIFTLVAISLDRYHVILYPFKPKLRPKQCFIILLFVWIISFSISSINLYNFDIEMAQVIKSNASVELPRCSIKDKTLFKYHKISVVLIQYVIPFVILSFTYFRIGYSIHYGIVIEDANHKQEKNRRKVVKMIFIVISLFMICWFPIQLYNTVTSINENINGYEYIHVVFFVSYFFAMSNSCYNVFIYGLCSARYKSEIRKFFSCLPCVDASKIDDSLNISRHLKPSNFKNNNLETRETMIVERKNTSESLRLINGHEKGSIYSSHNGDINKKIIFIPNFKTIKLSMKSKDSSIKMTENVPIKSSFDGAIDEENSIKTKKQSNKPKKSLFAKIRNKKTDIDRQIQKLY